VQRKPSKGGKLKHSSGLEVVQKIVRRRRIGAVDCVTSPLSRPHPFSQPAVPHPAIENDWRRDRRRRVL